MRAFQVFCVAVAASTAYGVLPYGVGVLPSTHVVTSGSSLGYAAPVAYTTGYGSAYSTAVAAAPVAHYATTVAQPVSVGVVAHAPVQKVQTHEVHTSSGQQTIRLEDFQAGDQVVRVHEGPQAPPQIAQVTVPGEQHHVRVVNHQSGPAHVERVVHRQPTQVVDLQKPGRPGVQIVQVVKGQNPAPSVEFVETGGSSHHVYNADHGVATVGVAHAVAAPVVTQTSHVVHAPTTFVTGHSYGYGYPFGVKKA